MSDREIASKNEIKVGHMNKMKPEKDKDEASVISGWQEREIVYTQTKRIIPDLAVLAERRIVSLQRYDPLADLFRILRTKVLKQLRTHHWNSFTVTAPTQGAGKSMVAINLAISLAMEGNQTVLLVDLDLRYPKLHWYFDIEPEWGILDAIQNNIPLNRIMINPGVDGLVLLPGKEQTRGSSELLTKPQMKELIHDIKSRYAARIIVFDMPPLLLVDDVLASMDYYDAVLMVVEDGVNKPDEIKKSLQLLSNTNLLGIVLNKSEHLPEHQGYY